MDLDCFLFGRPFILDESIDDVLMLIRVANDHAADVVNLKISKLGGLTKTKQVRKVHSQEVYADPFS